MKKSNLFSVWVVFFCYATVAAILFQKLVLPQIPSLHAGNGLMKNDAIYFHQVASELAIKIKELGWGQWRAWPATGVTGNGSILAALYVVFGTDPSVVIPVNAALHASGGLLLLLLGMQICEGMKGVVAGLIAATLFITFPSALSWYAQVHKDGYVIAGIFLNFYMLIRLLNAANISAVWPKVILGSVLGLALVAFVKPYILKIYAIAVISIVIQMGFSRIISKKRIDFGKVIALALMAAVSIVISMNLQGDGEMSYFKAVNYAGNFSHLGKFIEGQLETMIAVRNGMIQHSLDVGAGSLIDSDIRPDTILGIIAYLPRALQIGLFSPFPNFWLDKLSLIRLISVGETVVWYCLIPGIFLALFRKSNFTKWSFVLFSVVFLTIFGFVQPNIGTLYRMRFPVIFLLVLLGAVGWVEFFAEMVSLRDYYGRYFCSFVKKEKDSPPSVNRHPTSVAKVLGSAGVVVALTFLSFLGFFIRDVLMARNFGIGAELDGFIAGMMVPMFFVSVFSMPIGTAMIPQLLDLRMNHNEKKSQQLVDALVFFSTIFLLSIAAILFFSPIKIIELVGVNFTENAMAHGIGTLSIFIPILALSGLVIIANSILNAMNKFFLPGLVQLIVPFAAIASLFLLKRDFGIFSVAIGMVVGQILNLLFLLPIIKTHGFSLLPAFPVAYRPLISFWKQYLPLVGAAFFTCAAVPINNAMASTLAEGSVASLGVGAKMVLFLSGLIGTAVTTVMVPYFSRFSADKQHAEASRELAYFLILSTFLSVPFTVFLYAAGDLIVNFIFHGGVLRAGNTEMIAKVFKYGSLQIPFFTCGMLFMRFSTARNRSGLVLFSSSLCLIFNISFNLVFMSRMGAAGIALATTMAFAVSSVFLLFMFLVVREISLENSVLIAMSWILFLTFSFCLHFASYVCAFVVFIAYSLQVIAQFKTINMRCVSA